MISACAPPNYYFGGVYMVYKCKADGTEIKVRRLLWREYRQHQKKMNQYTKAGKDTTDLIEETVAQVIDPPEALEKLDVREVLRIYQYAAGVADSIEDSSEENPLLS